MKKRCVVWSLYLCSTSCWLLLFFNLITSPRENKTKILEFLCKSWAIDRRTDWSIWMVYSKVAMPHQYMSNRVEGTSLHHGVHGSSLNTRRLTDDVIIFICHYKICKIHCFLLLLSYIFSAELISSNVISLSLLFSLFKLQRCVQNVIGEV